jgi:hypothetical protein
LSAERLEGPYGLVRLRLRVENASAWHDPSADRSVALRHSLVAAHSLIGIDHGVFLSLLDPPEWAKPFAEACQTMHTWPVLIGEEGRRDAMLSSPIILYDHPTIAPESPGDLFDATEIDEILTLRTMAPHRGGEARGPGDRRARGRHHRPGRQHAPRAAGALHGAVRYLKGVEGGEAETEIAPAVEPGLAEGMPELGSPMGGPLIGEGSRARRGGRTAVHSPPGTARGEPRAGAVVGPWRRPDGVAGDRRGGGGRGDPGQGEQGAAAARAARADAQDMFLAGREATVEAVFLDVDGNRHLAVTLDEDPAADLQRWHGRYLYFSPDEVEPR